MIVYIKLLLTAAFWGGTFIAARVAAENVGPFSGSFLRFAVASLFLVVITTRIEGGLPRLKRGQIIPVLLLGMTGVFAYNVFFFLGLQTVTAGRASVIIAMNPIFIALFASLLFRERLSRINAAGILLCVAGAVIVISEGAPLALLRGELRMGDLYILGCVASWVLYSLIGKRTMQEISPMAAVTYSCLIGGGLLFIPAWMEGLFADVAGYRPVEWLGITYLGVFGSVLGFTWFYEGIQAIGASRAAVFINFVPVSAVIIAFFLLGETLDISLAAGGAMVIGGAWMTNRNR